MLVVVAGLYLQRENILLTYRSLTWNQVLDYAMSYIFTESLNAQDDSMLFECIMNSLKGSAIFQLSLRLEEFEIQSQTCGILLLKTVIGAACIDSNATAVMA